MPVIPTFENDIAVPHAPGPPRVGLDQFAEPGAALVQAGNAVSAEGQQWLSQYADAKRQADAAELVSQGMQQLGQKRFTWSHTDDSQAAFDGYGQDAAAIIKQTVARSADPIVQQYVNDALTKQGIIDQENVRTAAFGLEASKRIGQLDTTLTGYAQQAALAPDDMTRAHYVDLAHQAIAGAAAGHWLAPQQAADRGISFTSQIAEVKARRFMANDPIGAAHVLQDPQLTAEQFPGLLPEKGAALAGEAVWRAMRVESRNAAAQAHADAMARLNLHRLQQQNETDLLVAIHNGEPVDEGRIADAARHGLISPGGLNTIYTAQRQANAGEDDVLAKLQLLQSLNQRALTPEMIHTAVDDRAISARTATSLMQAVAEQDKVQVNAVDGKNFSALRTAVGVDANASLLAMEKPADRAAHQALWAQAQMEWTQRVLIQHQDSTAVLHDMLPRYTQPPQDASALPRPLLGAVQNSGQLHDVAVATYQAFQQHKIDQPTYDREVDLLNRYRALLATAPTAAPAPAATRSAPAARPSVAAPTPAPSGVTMPSGVPSYWFGRSQ